MADPFKISALKLEVPTPEGLSNTERAMLRELTLPGNPLWKVLRSMIDYGEDLKQSLMSVDLDDPEELKAARKIQATIVGVFWVQQVFESALTDVEEQETESGEF